MNDFELAMKYRDLLMGMLIKIDSTLDVTNDLELRRELLVIYEQALKDIRAIDEGK